MSERYARTIDRIDQTGGRLVARFWGTLLLAGLVAALSSLLVFSIAAGSWTGVFVAIVVGVPGFALVRYLFSPDRRLSEIE